MGVSRRVKPSFGVAAAAVFIMGSSSTLCWIVYHWILKPLRLEFLSLITFVLIVSSFVQFVETYTKKMALGLYRSVGIYLILLASNCAVLAPPLENQARNFGFLESVINAVGLGLGFGMAIILMSYIRERLETSDVPETLRGMPIAFITTGLLALAFMGFIGLIKV